MNNLIVKTDAQRVILEEISRLAKTLAKNDGPPGSVEITAIIIDMLTHVMLGKMSVEELIKTVNSHPVLASVHDYYVEFFGVLVIY